LLAAAGDLGGQAGALALRAELIHDHGPRAEAEAEAARAWLDAEDTGAALAAARRAVEQLDLAEKAHIEVAPATRVGLLALLGDMAWRHREWNDVARCYGEILALGDTGDVPAANIE